MSFPGGRSFAFTILDDTDVATVENVAPVYELLHSLGMRTTKTVWPLSCGDPRSNFTASETLQDPHYLDFVLELKRRGFEITWHGATMESSVRGETLRGLSEFRRLVGHFPRVHVNHAENRENLYWGAERVDHRLLRRAVRRMTGAGPDHYLGHVQGSAYWWGDAATEHIEYCRNLTFSRINLRRINPTLPYRDPRRPLVRWWFSASDAEDVTEFRRLLRPSNLDRLEREGGVCIVATHLGKGFVRGGTVDPVVRGALESLAARPGWFPPVGELLDWLRQQQDREELPPGEWRRMQLQWLLDLFTRKAATALQRGASRLTRRNREDETNHAGVATGAT